MSASNIADAAFNPDFETIRSRIEAWSFPDVPIDAGTGYRVPFTSCLARRLDIKEGSAALLVSEYRRFMVLKALSHERLTPSAMIDEVWHLHLSLSDDYGAFCQNAANCDISHTTGLPRESSRRSYIKTRAYYKKIFGQEPPSEAWPILLSRKFNACIGAISLFLAVIMYFMVTKIFKYNSDFGFLCAFLLFVVLTRLATLNMGIVKGEATPDAPCA